MARRRGPHRASILTGYALLVFKQSRVQAFVGVWQAQLIVVFHAGCQLGALDAYWTGMNPFMPRGEVPDGYYFNACSPNAHVVRQNCATPDQPAV